MAEIVEVEIDAPECFDAGRRQLPGFPYRRHIVSAQHCRLPGSLERRDRASDRVAKYECVRRELPTIGIGSRHLEHCLEAAGDRDDALLRILRVFRAYAEFLTVKVHVAPAKLQKFTLSTTRLQGAEDEAVHMGVVDGRGEERCLLVCGDPSASFCLRLSRQFGMFHRVV